MSTHPDQPSAPPPPPPPKPKLTSAEQRQRREDRLTTIRLRMAIGRELDERDITTPTAIGEALGMPGVEVIKLLIRHQWREGDVALLEALAVRLGGAGAGSMIVTEAGRPSAWGGSGRPTRCMARGKSCSGPRLHGTGGDAMRVDNVTTLVLFQIRRFPIAEGVRPSVPFSRLLPGAPGTTTAIHMNFGDNWC